MSKNTNLHKAKKQKNDEFYTQLVDIENELRHYKDHFKDKVVYCNCDDPYESNFVKYFLLNFNYLGLKRLIATCYGGSKFQPAKNDLWLVEDSMNERNPYKIDISFMPEDIYTIEDIESKVLNKDNVKLMNGDGDFRSEESINLLKQSDIVVTNPPFSLFREYISQLITYNKKFLIIGSKSSLNYLCPHIKYNRLWLGYNHSKGSMEFDSGNRLISVASYWYTNLSHKKRHEFIDLYKEYNPEEYPKYDNYDAINVDKVSEIPKDYYDIMGVPITFLDKYNPEQFSIIGITYSTDKNPDIELIRTSSNNRHIGLINGIGKYPRVLIKRK